jgi:hypothetical protein
MSAILETAMNAIRAVYDAEERATQNAIYQKESAVKFQYSLRAFIEGELKRKADPAVVLEAVIAKLKPMTPSGAEMKIDL